MPIKDKIRIREYNRLYKIKNKDKLKKLSKEWYEKNRSIVIERAIKHNKENPEKRSIISKRYFYKNKKKIRDYRKNRLKTDLNFRIKVYCSSRIRYAMKHTKVSSTLEYLGCSIEELRIHLEGQFTQGMNWNNYGYTGWHIDHIKPVSLFNLNNTKEVSDAFNYKNLQPMWGIDNIKKSNKYYVRKINN